MEKTELIKNPRGVKLRILVGSIGVVVIGLMVSFFFWLVADMSPGFEKTIVILTWVGLTGIWLISSLKHWVKWRQLQYFLGPESLIVKRGKVASSVDDYYRYDSIISVTVEMNKLGQSGDYGDIHIRIPKLDKSVVLHDIDQPDVQVEKLKHAVTVTGSTKSLVT